MQFRLFALAILGCFWHVSHADTGSHCVATETTMWTCSTKQKVYELCASKDLGKGQGYLQYRAGRIGQIEFVYPSSKRSPIGQFKHQLYARNAGLRFHNGQYEYELFDALIGSSELRVFRRDGKLVSEIVCAESNETFTGTSTINLFKDVGIYD